MAQIRLDFIQLSESVERRAAPRAFSPRGGFVGGWVYPDQVFNASNGVNHRDGRMLQKSVQFAAKPIQPSRLDLDDTFRPGNIGHKGAYSFLMVGGIGLHIKF